MPSPNQNSAEMNAWLAKANANQFVPSREFGTPGAGTQQGNPTDESLTGAGRNVSSDGSLDSDN